MSSQAQDKVAHVVSPLFQPALPRRQALILERSITRRSNQNQFKTLALVAAASALMLGACGKNDDRTVGQKIDGAISTTEKKAEQAKRDMSKEMAEAQAATERATDAVVQKVEKAAGKVGTAVADATVTASVNAELAKDAKLSALRINVDTTNGRVLLSGSAPDADSRERATRLAGAVKGVTSVENRLQVGG